MMCKKSAKNQHEHMQDYLRMCLGTPAQTFLSIAKPFLSVCQQRALKKKTLLGCCFYPLQQKPSVGIHPLLPAAGCSKCQTQTEHQQVGYLCLQGSYEAAAAHTKSTAILRELGAYLMPKDNPEYRWRIGTALTLLIASKGLNVAVRPILGLNSPVCAVS